MKRIYLTVLVCLVAMAVRGQDLVYKRMVVVEEVASTSCQGCPRGIVVMEQLKEKYPDSFIGIVAHIRNDPMEVSSYVNPLADEYIQSYPSVIVNRKKDKVGDPMLGEGFYLEEMEIPAINALAVSANYEEGSTNRLELSLYTKFAFASSDANYRYAVVVTENNVTGPSPAYDQVNGYAGGTIEMGGFELLPNPVPASQMKYQQVARGIFPEYKGTATHLPSSFEKDEVLSFSYTFDLPDNLLNKANIEVIVLLLDGTSGEIVNAAKVSGTDFNPISNEAVAVAPSSLQATMHAGPQGITVNVNSSLSNPVRIEVFTLNGINVYQQTVAGNGQYTIPVADRSSVYIVKVGNGKDTIVRKLSY